MKSILTIPTLLLLLSTLIASIAEAQTKHAVVVAIGNYPAQTGWRSISSQNDIPLIRQVLDKQGFQDITILRDQQADHDGILKALRDLTARAKKGDKIFIHFSSHGQQITDQDGDEADDLDEAIVCYGAPIRAEGQYANYDGSKHLRDEELGALIDVLRTQIGSDGDILLLADACHSGTITRGGTAKLRGTGQPLKLSKKNVAKFVAKNPPNKAFLYTKTPSQTGMAPYVVISAANANESNSECWLSDGETPVGSLSFSFNQAMQQSRKGESYRDLFGRIQSIMKQNVPGQTPQIEGDYDRELFGGKIVQQETYLTVKQVNANKQQLVLNSGQLTGVFDSTKVNICPVGTRDGQKGTVIASGIVIKSSPYAVVVELDKPVPSTNPADYWVFVTEQSTGDLSVTISLDSLKDASLRQRIEAELKKNRLVRFKGQPNLYLNLDNAQPASLQFRRATDGTKLDVPVPESQLFRLSEQVQHYAQSQYLQRFTVNDNPNVRVSLKLIPLKKGATKPADTVSTSNWQVGSMLGFTEEDKVAVQVTNLGTIPVYYTVLDITPNGIVSVIFPRQGDALDKPENYVVPPGKSALAWKFVEFEPPYGQETFKVFATTEPVDLRKVVGTTRGLSAARSAMKRLERLYDDSNDMAQKGFGTRGGKSSGFSDDANMATFNYEFLILDKKATAAKETK